jgi:hypothetical protein
MNALEVTRNFNENLENVKEGGSAYWKKYVGVV